MVDRTGSGEGRAGKVLVVEDEADVAEMIRYNLGREGYEVRLAATGTDALRQVKEVRPDLILLDIMVPHLNGWEICRRLRQDRETQAIPVIMVTGRVEEGDKVLGFEMGADDYVTKPFSPRELVARVTGVLRRANGVPEAAPQTVGAITLDAAQRRVYAGDGEIDLTATEFDLLAYLMRRPGRVFTREQLLSEVWGYAAVAGTRTVDVHIAQLRAKLAAASPIRTVRGVGYAAEDVP